MRLVLPSRRQLGSNHRLGHEAGELLLRHNSLRFPVLLLFFNASSRHPFHPLNRHPDPAARTWRRPFSRCRVPSAQTPTPDRKSLPATIPTLSHESETCNRSPAISPTACDTRPPDLPPAPLMDTDFAISCPLVRRRRPQIQFLSIGPYLCSTLPLDPTSRWCPCASLPFTSIRLGRDFHPLAAEHARRTTKRPRLKTRPLS
jgi:hypothetical protein